MAVLVFGALEDLLQAIFRDQDARGAHEIQSVEIGGIGENRAAEVAAGAEHRLGPRAIDDEQALAGRAHVGEDLGETLGLRLSDFEFFDHRDTTVSGELKERSLEGDFLGLSGDGLGPVARTGTEDDTTLVQLGGALVAVARTAGTLLREHLLTRTGDFAVILGLGSTLALIGLVGNDDLLEQSNALGAFERRNVEFLLGEGGSVGLVNFELHSAEMLSGLLGGDGLLGRTNEDNLAVGTGETALDEQKVFFREDLDDAEVLDSTLHLAHVARHTLTLKDVTRSLAHADRADSAVHHVTVGVRLAIHVVALHDALETTALDRADHVDHLAGGELLDGDDVADLSLSGTGLADFVKMGVGRDARLAKVADFAGRHAALLLGTETDLDGIIAILIDGLYLGDGTGARLDDRDRDEVIVRVIDLGHSDFFTE